MKKSTRELCQNSNIPIRASNCLGMLSLIVIVKNNYTRLKLFDVFCDNGSTDNKGETLPLYKCRYCVKTYTSITRYEVHFRTHVKLTLLTHTRPERSLINVYTVKRNSTKMEI